MKGLYAGMNGTATMLHNEIALVARARSEPDAFAAIYDHYFARVYNYVRYRVQEAQLADDITALVFERVWLKLDRYQPKHGAFGVWLFGIARNAVSDSFRRHRDWVSMDEVAHEPSNTEIPEEIAAANEQRETLLRAVARLKDREQELIALKFGAGLSNVEIARLNNMTESSVGISLYRAMQQLKNMMED